MKLVLKIQVKVVIKELELNLQDTKLYFRVIGLFIVQSVVEQICIVDSGL